ncbi:CAP domain-containing protein [Streptomyces sp. Tue6028]|uniref:CAP domain-containing protein n=1 Tax=Streptomyces sp. Tue6028 TaxID=2036037 RepID=UPI003D711C24
MRKHRRKTRHRQIAVAALALGALAVPTAAMACWDDQGTRTVGSAGQWQNVSDDDWQLWLDAAHRGQWQSQDAATPSATPTTQAPSAPASAAPSAPGTHKAKKTHAGHKTWHRKWHKPSASHKPAAPTASAPAKPAAPQAPAPTKPAAPKPSTSAPATSTPSASTPPSSAPSTSAPASGAVARIVALVNSERSKAGCSAVTLNAKLSKAAQAHSADMASHQNMSHTGSDGSDPGQRITSAGYSWSSYGENVAYGYSTPEQVMAGWMASPGHRENILNCSFKEIGVGLAQPGDYWTQDFGTAR